MHLFRKIKRATLAFHLGKQALLFDFIIVLSEVIVHYFAAIYLFPYDKSVTRFRIVFEGQKCAKLRILALFRCSSHPIFCLKIYFISRLPAVSLPKNSRDYDQEIISAYCHEIQVLALPSAPEEALPEILKGQQRCL